MSVIQAPLSIENPLTRLVVNLAVWMFSIDDSAFSCRSALPHSYRLDIRAGTPTLVGRFGRVGGK